MKNNYIIQVPDGRRGGDLRSSSPPAEDLPEFENEAQFANEEEEEVRTKSMKL